MSQFTYAVMYRKALGAMNYTPERFGLMRVGVFFDALAGYNEAEGERIKSVAELIRTSTTILRNIQVVNEADLKTAQQLWRFPWDKPEDENTDGLYMSEEEMKRTDDDLLQILKRKTGNGNSDQQPES